MHFVLYMELRRRQSLRSLVYRVRRLGQAALARQGLDPATAPLLLMLHLRSAEHTSERQSLMRISSAALCLQNTKIQITSIIYCVTRLASCTDNTTYRMP